MTEAGVTPAEARAGAAEGGVISGRPLARGTSWLWGGNIVGQAAWFGSLVVLGALLPPQAFGAVAIGIAIATAALVQDAGSRGTLVLERALTAGDIVRVVSLSVAIGIAIVVVRAIDLTGNSRPTAGVSVTASSVAVVPPLGYFSTLPSQPGGLPTSDSYCAANVTTSTWEPRPDNYTANHTVPSNLSLNPSGGEMNHWVRWMANRSLVTGNYRGTTNQIIQWAGCKWGIDENLLRAVAVQESDWHENMVGDICGPVGEASYGLFQIKNKYCNGSWAWGGYDYSAKNSAFNADFYAAYIRSCLDNDFYDGGSWLYGGRTIAEIISTNGFDDAVWGCVGSWYSGNWYDSGARNYISSVQNHLAKKDWPSL